MLGTFLSEKATYAYGETIMDTNKFRKLRVAPTETWMWLIEEGYDYEKKRSDRR